MPTPPSSTIQITYDGTDITDFVLFESAHFECQASAMAGTFGFVVKDVDRTMTFETGKEVYLIVDDHKLFGGIVLQVGRKLAFPVDDTTDIESVESRQWVIEGSDFNVWFDKRVIRDPSNYLEIITFPFPDTLGDIIREKLPLYIDVPPGVDMTTFVDDVGPPLYTDSANYSLGNQQGDYWRKIMDTLAAEGGAVYYIDADKKLHFHAFEQVMATWAFVDHAPNGTTRIPCRDVIATQDGSKIVTDALVWGGLETETNLFFARYPDPPADDDREVDAIAAQNEQGIWQYAESHFNNTLTQNGITERAKRIISGPTGADPLGTSTGLRRPLWRVNLTWYAHSIPRVGGEPQHLHPGHIARIFLYVMGQSPTQPMIQFLPLRNLSITFPALAGDGETWVMFNGEFGLSYTDSRDLWRFLMRRRGGAGTVGIGGGASFAIGGVDNDSTSSSFGDFATLTPNEAPDGSRTQFSVNLPLIQSSIEVYVNGLRWREGFEYQVTGPSTIELNDPLASDDQIYIEARTGTG